MTSSLRVLEHGALQQFSYEQLLRHHAGNSPGGVAHAFKVMELAFELLGEGAPLERREVTIATAFGGPGARDAFESVTGAVSDGRFVLDEGLARPERGVALERFVFRVGYRDLGVVLGARAGFVDDELIVLVRKDTRSDEEEARLDVLKRDMAALVMSAPAAEVYEQLR